MILATFCLDRDHIMAAVFVESDVEFVDFDLPHTLDSCPKMVLKTIGREAEECVDQAVVPDDCQQGLFVVVERIGSD